MTVLNITKFASELTKD